MTEADGAKWLRSLGGSGGGEYPKVWGIRAFACYLVRIRWKIKSCACFPTLWILPHSGGCAQGRGQGTFKTTLNQTVTAFEQNSFETEN
jgi:hypothetical protein